MNINSQINTIQQLPEEQKDQEHTFSQKQRKKAKAKTRKITITKKKFLCIIIGFVLTTVFVCICFLQSCKPSFPQIPIIYIWLGAEMPEKYKNKLNQIPYPHIFLTNKDWQKYEDDFKKYELLNIEKADLLRMFYLYQNGGFYADFDIIIGYACLMENIQKVQDLHLISDPTWKWSNGLMYVQQPKNQNLQKLIDWTVENVKIEKGHKIRTGPWNYKQIDFMKSSLFIDGCVEHLRQGTWRKEVDSKK